MDSPDVRAISGAGTSDEGGRVGRAACRRDDAAPARLRLTNWRRGRGDDGRLDAPSTGNRGVATHFGERSGRSMTISASLGSGSLAFRSRDYTYGGAAEWYKDWYKARASVFDLSQAPTSAKLSNGFAQGQFVAELGERHAVWDQPGKLKLLYWPTRRNLGTYLDAISFGAATDTAPSTGAVRSFRTKDGWGLISSRRLLLILASLHARACHPRSMLPRRRVQLRPIRVRLSAHQPPGLQPRPRSGVDFRPAASSAVLIAMRCPKRRHNRQNRAPSRSSVDGRRV